MYIKEISSSEIDVAGVHLVLLPEAAIYIPSRKELLIADLHLGKVEHFRKNGIGVPGEVSDQDIETLHSLIATYLPDRVVFLGDLFHSSHNSSWSRFIKMITHFSDIDFHLVIGNHDILESEKYNALILCNQYDIGNIICTHEPLTVPISERYNLCGHIHPGVRLRGKGKQYLRLPCYFFGAQTGIMPAFGSFTGLYTVKPTQEDKVYVLAENEVSRVH